MIKRAGFFGRLGALIAAAPIVAPLARVAAPVTEAAPQYEIRLAGLTADGKYVETISNYIDRDISAMSAPEITSLVRSMHTPEAFAEDFDRFEIWQFTSRSDGRAIFQGAMHEGRIPAGWDDLTPHGWIRR